MKNVILVLSLIIATAAMVACSKGSGNSGTNYATTPGANCGSGTYPGVNYYQPGYAQQNGYYPNQYPQQNVNCISQNNIYGGNPYYFQANYQVYLGTCDLRFTGRGQLCPAGYQCRPISVYGSTGICMRGY